MKKIAIISAFAVFILASCVGNPEGKKAETSESVDTTDQVVGDTYVVDTEQSTVAWLGSKISGSHNGTVDVKSGEIHIEDGQVTGGNFVLDMNTIISLDLEGEYKEKLEGHLKSDDFFSVEEFPEASFQITDVKASEVEGELVVSGNLTIKGISKNITFDANVVESTESSFTATADFNIEREQWEVNYAGNADDLISKEINFKLEIVASK